MLLTLLIAVLVIGLIFLLLREAPLPQPWKNTALLLVIIIAIIYLLGFLPAPAWHWHK